MRTTTKRCTHCSRSLPRLDFYRWTRAADGLSSWCKECTLTSQKAYRSKNATLCRARDKARSQTPKRKTYMKAYSEEYRQRPEAKARKKELSKSPAYRAWEYQYKKQRYKANLEKIKARQALNRAVARGKLQRLPCQICGNPKSEGHHEDYSRRLDVEWLCGSCHREHRHRQDSGM